jgi:hypothetical protein
MIKVPVNKPSQLKEALVWKTITDTIGVKTTILNQQKLHFSQAKDTPFTRKPLKSIFNWSGTSPQAERVLSQQHVSPYNITSTTDQLLQCCYRKLPEPPPEITLQAMKQKYPNWSKGTSTLPSGQHLGHKHALLRPCAFYPTSPQFEQLGSLRQTI